MWRAGGKGNCPSFPLLLDLGDFSALQCKQHLGSCRGALCASNGDLIIVAQGLGLGRSFTSLAGKNDMPDTEGSQVIVVGAGIAGLSAALRLAERDFKVTLVEQNNFLGGKLGSAQTR